MKLFLTGMCLGWLVATVGVNGLVRIGEKIAVVVSTQAVELAK
jgi:hypothetical protein